MPQNFDLLQVVAKGGWAIGILILMSIVVFGVFYDRWKYFKAHFRERAEVLAELEPFLNRKNFSECLEACDRDGTLLAIVLAAGLRAKTQKTDPQAAMEREAKVQLLALEKRLPLLATIGSLAPYMGLLGTVWGIIKAFRDLALANAGGAAVVSQGISEALISTAAGLFVAITSVFFYNSFQTKLNEMAQEAEILISEIQERFGN